MTDVTPPPAAALDPGLFQLIIASFARTVGRPLVGHDEDPTWLYADAPFALLAHGAAADPLFIYANRTAQRCFEYSFDELLTIPSRMSAEASNREERQRLLDAVARDGFIDNYRGLRIAKSGRRFWIESAIVWELADEKGTRRGQAAMFSSWADV